MKVEGPGKSRLHTLRDSATVKQAGRSEAQPTQGERVEVSKLGKSLAEARQSPSELDTARIERLKDAIANGSFTIDAERIATAMMNEER